MMRFNWKGLKLQFWGILYIVSLLLSIIFIDKLVVQDLHFSLEVEKWPCTVIAMIVSCFVCFVSFILVKRKETKAKADKRSWNEKIMLMITNTGKGNFLDILVLFAFLAFAAWIPDAFLDYVKEGKCFIRPFVYIAGLALLVWGKPSVVPFETVIAPDNRKMLMTGMSNVNTFNHNIYPLIEPLKTYKYIEKLVILLSNSIWTGYENIDPSKEDEAVSVALNTYKQELGKLDLNKKENVDNSKFQRIKFLLDQLLKVYIKEMPDYQNKDIEIVFSEPVDYNNFDVCNDVCYYLMKEEMRKGGYKDSQVVVNVSPGTSVVASAMTLNAIKGNRAMIYTTQGKKTEVIAANPKATLIQFGELFTERATE